MKRIKNDFEFGPVQKEWLRILREHPERQGKYNLLLADSEYNLEKGHYRACCLGQLMLCYAEKADYGMLIDFVAVEYTKTKLAFREDKSVSTVFPKFYQEYGLRDSHGAPLEKYKKRIAKFFGEEYDSSQPNQCDLGNLNDSDCPWPKIAELIEKFPEAYLCKSV